MNITVTRDLSLIEVAALSQEIVAYLKRYVGGSWKPGKYWGVSDLPGAHLDDGDNPCINICCRDDGQRPWHVWTHLPDSRITTIGGYGTTPQEALQALQKALLEDVAIRQSLLSRLEGFDLAPRSPQREVLDQMLDFSDELEEAKVV